MVAERPFDPQGVSDTVAPSPMAAAALDEVERTAGGDMEAQRNGFRALAERLVQELQGLRRGQGNNFGPQFRTPLSRLRGLEKL